MRSFELVGFLIRGSQALGTVLVGMYVARLAGPALFGVVMFHWTLGIIVAGVCALGIPLQVQREATAAHGKIPHDLAARSYRSFVRASVPASCGLGLVVSVLGSDRFSAADIGLSVAIGSALIGLEIESSLMRSAGRYTEGQVLSVGLFPVLCLVVFVAVGELSGPRTPRELLSLMAAVSLVLWLASGAVRRRRTSIDESPMPRDPLEADRGSGWRLGIVASASIVLTMGGGIAVGLVSSDVEVAEYAASFHLASVVAFGLVVVNGYQVSVVVRTWKGGDREQLQSTIVRATRTAAAVAVPASLGLLLVGGFALDYIYGLSSPLTLYVLVVGHLVSASCGPIGLILIAMGHERRVLARQLAAIALMAGVSGLLGPQLGALGVAIGTASAVVVLNLWLVVELYRRERLVSLAFAPRRSQNPDQRGRRLAGWSAG